MTKVGPCYGTQLLNLLGIISVIGQCGAGTLLSNDGVVGVHPADRLGTTDDAVILAVGLRMRFDIYEVQEGPSDDRRCFLTPKLSCKGIIIKSAALNAVQSKAPLSAATSLASRYEMAAMS